MENLISVIIPVYNVAAYLPQCLDSVLNQDHKDLEVILIDDGSTDASGSICDEYAAKDSRVRVIHQKNGGGAAAKNAGLRVATGEYLSFVDSDDYLEPQVYGRMLSVLKEAEADIAVFSYRDVYPSRTEEQHLQESGTVESGTDYLKRFLKGWTCALLWNKLYRREVFNGIFFEEGHKIDDEYFTYQGVMNARKVVLDDTIIYNYRRRASSVMQDPAALGRRIMERLDAYGQRREKVGARFPELRRAFDHQYLDALTFFLWEPGVNESVILCLKRNLGKYLLQKGNTFPPRFLWRELLKLGFGSPKYLLRAYKEKIEWGKQENLFP